MAQIPFLGPTYNGRSSNFDASRCINFYPELSPTPDSKSVIALIGTPGCSLFTFIGSAPIRAMYPFNNALFVVMNNQLYSVSSTGTVSAALGTLTAGSGRVTMADNGIASAGVGGNQLIIVDGQNGYIYNVNTSTFSTISGGGFPSNPSSVTFMDGYFIVTNSTMSHWVSNIYDGTTWNALATSPVSGAPDNVQTVINLQQQLFFIKQYTTEIWQDAGTPTSQGSPFQRVSGAVMDYGTPAPYSVARGAGSLFFLANQRNNSVDANCIGVVMIQGYTPTVISTPSIAYRIIHNSTDLTQCFGYCYSDEGHIFYVLTNPVDNWTLVYDATTNMWHERSAYTTPYEIGRHIGNCYAKFNNKHYVGSYIDGSIYQMSSDNYTDFGNPIVSVRRAQHIFDRGDLDDLFISRLVVDMETGVGQQQPANQATATATINGSGQVTALTVTSKGADYTSTPIVVASGGGGTIGTITPIIAQGGVVALQLNFNDLVDESGNILVDESANYLQDNVGGSGYSSAPIISILGGAGVNAISPCAMLRWSNDGAHTWSDVYQTSIGSSGQYKQRAIWRRLGRAKDRVFELSISDPVKKVIIGGYVEGDA